MQKRSHPFVLKTHTTLVGENAGGTTYKPSADGCQDIQREFQHDGESQYKQKISEAHVGISESEQLNVRPESAVNARIKCAIFLR